MKIYKFYAAMSSIDGLATLDITNEGIISAVSFAINPVGMDALSDFCRVELSFMSSGTFTTNDTRGSIAMAVFGQNFLTSGGGIAGSNPQLSGLEIEVHAGERIHIHGSMSSGVSGNAIVYVYVKEGKISKLTTRRFT